MAMPEGASVTWDLAVGQSPDRTYSLLMQELVPALGRASYRLRDHNPQQIATSRRYLSMNTAIGAPILILIAVAIQASSGGTSPGAIVVGWVGILALIFYRKRESLTLSIRPSDPGAGVMVGGHANKQAQQALRSFFDVHEVRADARAAQATR